MPKKYDPKKHPDREERRNNRKTPIKRVNDSINSLQDEIDVIDDVVYAMRLYL